MPLVSFFVRHEKRLKKREELEISLYRDCYLLLGVLVSCFFLGIYHTFGFPFAKITPKTFFPAFFSHLL
jgi:hypothetical protein